MARPFIIPACRLYMFRHAGNCIKKIRPGINREGRICASALFARKEVEKQKHRSHDMDYSIFTENVNITFLLRFTIIWLTNFLNFHRIVCYIICFRKQADISFLVCF